MRGDSHPQGLAVVMVGLVILSVGIVGGSGILGTPVAAQEDPETTTLTTEGSMNLGEYVRVSVTSQIEATLSPTSGGPGETTAWTLELRNSRVRIEGQINIGSVNTDFSETVPVSLGTTRQVPIPGTGGQVSLTIELSATAENIQVTSGPANTSVDSLTFSSSGARSFDIQISEKASPNEEITVSGIRVVPTIEVGLKEEVPFVGPGEIDSREIDARAYSPTVGASTTVSAGEALSPPVIAGGGAVGVGVLYMLWKRSG